MLTSGVVVAAGTLRLMCSSSSMHSNKVPITELRKHLVELWM